MITDLRRLIETELKRQISRLNKPSTSLFHEMLTYHMGWTGDGAGPEAAGKRIRPQLLSLVYLANTLEQDVRPVLPAAAAVELVHNFSLVHDDIEDNSPTRRGRSTLWVKWGVPMAINAGDALFVLADQAMMNLAVHHPAERVLRAASLLHDTCLNLTRGQYLDMSFEKRLDLNLDDYWEMISGKTAALISACCAIGAILSGAEKTLEDEYASFGRELGLAFQVQDDILGIWGSEDSTGKSTASDLVEGKKSLPVLYGLAQDREFARRWRMGPILPTEVPNMKKLLLDEGAYDYAQSQAKAWNSKAIADLEAAAPRGEAGQALFALTEQLLRRNN